MKSYLKIIRPLNLIIIAATMYLMRYCVINSFLAYNGLQLQVGNLDFLLLVLATVFIAAGGYVINDYYDFKANMVNKSCDSVIIGTNITLKGAMRYYIILTFAGFALGTWFAVRMGNLNYATLFLFVGGLLWFYSNSYKAIMFVGNLLVAVLAGMVPLLVVMFEMIKFNENYHDLLTAGKVNYMPIFYFVAGFASFAFFSTFIREIVKDIEDIDEDNRIGKKTFPVAAGINPAKFLVAFLILVEIVAIYYLYWNYLQDSYSLYYFTLAIVLPLLIALYLTFKHNEPAKFKTVSNILKLTMITGLGYSLIICIQLIK